MIHSYKLLGMNIVIDVNSGGVHVVDDAAFDMINAFDGGSKDEVVASVAAARPGEDPAELSELYDEILTLKNKGALFSPDTFESAAERKKNAAGGVIKALCLHVAHTCNLTCAYCFAGQGKYHGRSALMSYETGKRALDFLIENSGSRRNLELDFFGGEPLMNFGVVQELTAYARSVEKDAGKNFRFTLTTNGMLIDDEVIDFCNREMSNVVLSLDGRKEIHDRYRVDPMGNGSWDRIVPKFQKLVKARGDKSWYMRGTFTHRNPDFLEDIKQMLALGFDQLSMEPVVCAPGDEGELTSEDMPVIFEQYERLAELMKERDDEGRPFTFYHYMLDLKGGPCVYKRISGCGSGTEYMAVTPSGDLYPCHQFVGDERFRLGDVFGGITNQKIREDFASCSVYSREECRSCWAKLYCSGGCAANAYHSTGSVNGVYKYGCELFKKRMECAVALAAYRQLRDEA